VTAGTASEAWVLLHPLDVVTFRDGRPFTTGVTATGRTSLPRPSSLGGAIGQALGSNPARIIGPVLVHTGGPVPRVLLPAPADLVLDRDRGLARLHPQDRQTGAARADSGAVTAGDPAAEELPAGVRSDLPDEPGCPAELVAGRGDPLTINLDADLIERYLAADVTDVLEELAAGAPEPELIREVRLGIARHARSAGDGTGRTTIAGFLYQAEFWRPATEIVAGPDGAATGVGFGCRVVFDGPVPVPRSGMVRLGGEGRQASVTVLSGGDGAPRLPGPQDVSEGRVLLYLATPAVFPGGWRPPLPDGCALVAACTSGPEVISGIDGTTGRGRPLRWAVGAGSVYYLRFGDPAAASRYAADVHGECLEQAEEWMRTVGFGMCLVGRW
jgi:CRISPR-associated protein (Cas_Cmr3)